MPYKKINPLTETTTMDLEILSDLANNDAYFDSIIPDVYIRSDTNGTVRKSLDGVQLKVQGGQTSVAAFTGPKVITIPFIIANTGTSYVPPITLGIVSATAMTANLTSVTAKGFSVRLTPSIKGSNANVRILWIAITQTG